MKNAFKLGALALAISVSFAACSSKKTAGSADSTTKDSTTKMAVDSTAKPDSTKKDSTTTTVVKKDSTAKKM